MQILWLKFALKFKDGTNKSAVYIIFGRYCLAVCLFWFVFGRKDGGEQNPLFSNDKKR